MSTLDVQDSTIVFPDALLPDVEIRNWSGIEEQNGVFPDVVERLIRPLGTLKYFRTWQPYKTPEPLQQS